MFSALNGYVVFIESSIVNFDGYRHNGTSFGLLILSG
jgi:hypothetical protein